MVFSAGIWSVYLKILVKTSKCCSTNWCFNLTRGCLWGELFIIELTSQDNSISFSCGGIVIHEYVHFKNIDNTNEYKVRNIKLKPGQEKFIETVDECLKEAETFNEWHPVAIYYEDEIIGFAMYGSFGLNKDTWIDRIMIDEKHQGRGYGKLAMMKLIDMVSKEYEVNVIYLSITEENRTAYNLYKNIGFESMNERDSNNGELLFKYTIK